MAGGRAWLLAGFEGTAPSPTLERLAEAGDLAGGVLFARNCPDLDTVLALTAALRRLLPEGLIALDHEGGRVHRLPPPFTHFPPAAALGRIGDPALARAVARAMASELRAAGFTMTLAPVLDVLTVPDNPVIGDRAFGADPAAVGELGAAFVAGTLEAGLIPVGKHFPGHGRTSLDSHQALPTVEAGVEALEAVELPPFRAAIATGCPALMAAHVLVPALDPDWPASLSPVILGRLLRDRLGFSGLVLSDDLEMGAITTRWTVEAAASRFLEAGGDLALICRSGEHQLAAARAIRRLRDAGRLAEEEARRARRRAAWGRLGPAQGPKVIGAPEHRALAEEVRRRAGEAFR